MQNKVGLVLFRVLFYSLSCWWILTDSSSSPTQRPAWWMNLAAVIPSCPICHLFISPDVLHSRLHLPPFIRLSSAFTLSFSPPLFHRKLLICSSSICLPVHRHCPSKPWLCWINASVMWQSWAKGHLARCHMVKPRGFGKFSKSLRWEEISVYSPAPDVSIPHKQVCDRAWGGVVMVFYLPYVYFTTRETEMCMHIWSAYCLRVCALRWCVTKLLECFFKNVDGADSAARQFECQNKKTLTVNYSTSDTEKV